MCDRACQSDDLPEQLQSTSSQIMYVYNIAMHAAFVYMQQQCAVGQLLLMWILAAGLCLASQQLQAAATGLHAQQGIWLQSMEGSCGMHDTHAGRLLETSCLT